MVSTQIAVALGFEIDPVLVKQVFFAVVSAILYASVWYARARRKGREKFNHEKFVATLIVGACAGAGMGVAGVDVTAAGVESALITYAGIITLVEGILKTVLARPDANESSDLLTVTERKKE
jgi:uncharacterized membrane protein YfcA